MRADGRASGCGRHPSGVAAAWGATQCSRDTLRRAGSAGRNPDPSSEPRCYPRGLRPNQPDGGCRVDMPGRSRCRVCGVRPVHASRDPGSAGGLDKHAGAAVMRRCRPMPALQPAARQIVYRSPAELGHRPSAPVRLTVQTRMGWVADCAGAVTPAAKMAAGASTFTLARQLLPAVGDATPALAGRYRAKSIRLYPPEQSLTGDGQLSLGGWVSPLFLVPSPCLRCRRHIAPPCRLVTAAAIHLGHRCGQARDCYY